MFIRKSGEIQLCIDFHALNTITVCDSFPLPRIEEALQAVKASIWFTSFDLAQDIYNWQWMKRIFIDSFLCWVLQACTSLAHMPFGLSNAGASFCHLMEMCLGDQQSLTLLFYLDDICVFSNSVDEMLDRIAMVFGHLKEFNLKIEPKKSFFFHSSVYFWVIYFQRVVFCQILRRLTR